MASTYTLIQGYTLTSDAASGVTFSSIPQTYAHLVVRISARSVNATVVADIRVTINGNTSATYSNNRLYAVGNSASSGQDGGSGAFASYSYVGALAGNSATSTIFSGQEFFFPKYTSSGITKNGNSSSSATNNGLSADNWYSQLNTIKTSDTDPITMLKFETSGGTGLKTGSTLFLYGLASS